MSEAVQTSETLVNWYQSTRRYNPEDGHLNRDDYLIYSKNESQNGADDTRDI
jgi:hypothetical protein